MKQNLSIALALCALIVSIIAILREPKTPLDHRAKPMVFAAKVDDAPVKTCDDPKALGSLKDLMNRQINTSMTRISFALHHDPRPIADRLAAVVEHSELLIGCIEKMPSFRPDVGIEHLSEYYRYLDTMQANALALSIAAMENDQVRAQHWFTHLKQDCVACHTKFRPASEEPAKAQ